MPRKSKLTAFHDLVGTVPDREIAVMANASIATVCNYRRRHSIPSYRSRLVSEEPPTRLQLSAEAPAPPAPKTTQETGAWAYAVTLEDGDELFVIDEGIITAAERATAAGMGRVTGIRCVGPALV